MVKLKKFLTGLFIVFGFMLTTVVWVENPDAESEKERFTLFFNEG
mgnify:CR=1 FL=1